VIAPAITTQPASTTVTVGQTATFSVVASGTAPLSYQWRKNGTTVSGATSASYTAPAASTSDSGAAFSVVVTNSAGSVTSGDATLKVDSAPVSGAAMTTANRTSGVAPLAVFFDAADTVNEGTGGTPGSATAPPNWPFTWTSGVFQPADMEGSQFEWWFDDPSSGVWANDRLSKNTATGFTAAHVFETPGTYTVTLRVTSPDGRVDTYKQTITVTAFAGVTHYASASGTGDGTSASSPQSLSSGWSWVTGAPGRRLLLNRGDTFNISGLSASQTGMIVGAYGTGAAPSIVVTGGGSVWYSSTDITLMDLQIEPSGGSSSPGLINDANHRVDRFLALRLMLKGWAGVQTERVIGSLSNPNSGVAWVECTIDNLNQSTGMYVGGYQIAVMGGRIANTASHNLRLWTGAKAVVSHNRFEGGVGTYQHAFKFHSHEWEYSGTPESRWATVSDNQATYPAPWVMSVGPQNAQQIERVSHVVLERNHTWGDPGTGRTQSGLEISARYVMMRNNILDGTGGNSGGYTGALVQRRGIEPTPYNVRFLNNTVVRLDAGRSFSAVSMSNTDLAAVRNNIAWAPSASSRSMLNGSPTNLTVSNNLPVGTDPQFTKDYTLASALSPAVDTGVTLGEVRSDARGAARPLGVRSDIGAFECF